MGTSLKCHTSSAGSKRPCEAGASLRNRYTSTPSPLENAGCVVCVGGGFGGRGKGAGEGASSTGWRVREGGRADAAVGLVRTSLRTGTARVAGGMRHNCNRTTPACFLRRAVPRTRVNAVGSFAMSFPCSPPLK